MDKLNYIAGTVIILAIMWYFYAVLNYDWDGKCRLRGFNLPVSNGSEKN